MSAVEKFRKVRDVNEVYAIYIGPAELEKDYQGNVYKIYNKQNDMVEVEATVYPRAISMAQELKEMLEETEMDEIEAAMEEAEEAVAN